MEQNKTLSIFSFKSGEIIFFCEGKIDFLSQKIYKTMFKS